MKRVRTRERMQRSMRALSVSGLGARAGGRARAHRVLGGPGGNTQQMRWQRGRRASARVWSHTSATQMRSEAARLRPHGRRHDVHCDLSGNANGAAHHQRFRRSWKEMNHSSTSTDHSYHAEGQECRCPCI